MRGLGLHLPPAKLRASTKRCSNCQGDPQLAIESRAGMGDAEGRAAWSLRAAETPSGQEDEWTERREGSQEADVNQVPLCSRLCPSTGGTTVALTVPPSRSELSGWRDESGVVKSTDSSCDGQGSQLSSTTYQLWAPKQITNLSASVSPPVK